MSFNRKFFKVIKCFYKTRIPKIISGFFLLYFVFSGLFYIRQFDKSTNTNVSKKNRPHIILGILSQQKNYHFRVTQRDTWIKTMLYLKDVLPFIVTYKFLLDNPSSESIQENNLHNDIVYLNVSYNGRAVKIW